jgi:hypothetical protein
MAAYVGRAGTWTKNALLVDVVNSAKAVSSATPKLGPDFPMKCSSTLDHALLRGLADALWWGWERYVGFPDKYNPGRWRRCAPQKLRSSASPSKIKKLGLPRNIVITSARHSRNVRNACCRPSLKS